MSVNITLPMWLSIIIGIIIALDLFINVLKLIPKNIWIKILVFLFYKNNNELYKSKQMSKKAKDNLNAKLYIQEKQRNNLNKRFKMAENNSNKPSQN